MSEEKLKEIYGPLSRSKTCKKAGYAKMNNSGIHLNVDKVVETFKRNAKEYHKLSSKGITTGTK